MIRILSAAVLTVWFSGAMIIGAIGGNIAGARAQESTTSQNADKLLSAVSVSLEQSSRAYLEIGRAYWDPGKPIRARAVLSPISDADIAAGRLKGNWERMAAAVAALSKKDATYSVVIAVYDDAGKKVLWTAEQPIDPEPLASAARELVPDETIFSRIDPPATARFEIPGDRLKPGTRYRATFHFHDPLGAEHSFAYGSTPETGFVLNIRPRPLDLGKLRMPSRVADSPELLRTAEEIANPGQRRFAKDDPDDCQARSVWCLRAYQGRVYVGFGDWAKNRGPIPLWSFGPDDPQLAARYGRYAFRAGENPSLLFTQEYLVQEHSIERFHVWGDRLVLPGIDGLKEAGPDGMVFANCYIREKGHWRKLSSLEGTVHVTDVLGTGELLFAAVDRIGAEPASVVVSRDAGLSWKLFTRGGGELVAFQGGLLLLTGTQADVYMDRGTTAHSGEFTPGNEPDPIHRATPFQGGVLYTTSDAWGNSRSAQHPLFFLSSLDEGPRLPGPFSDKNVRDIVVEGQDVYVLSGRAIAGDGFEGEVYSSRDLNDWQRRAVFRSAAMPNALALLGAEFYAGLANRGFDAGEQDDLGPMKYRHADTAAGVILRLRP